MPPDDRWDTTSGMHATTAPTITRSQAFFTDPEAAAVGLTADQAAPLVTGSKRRSKSAMPLWEQAFADGYPQGAHGVSHVDRAICWA